jgi:hypothetical protein
MGYISPVIVNLQGNKYPKTSRWSTSDLPLRRVTFLTGRIFLERKGFSKLSISSMPPRDKVADLGLGQDIWTVPFDSITKILAAPPPHGQSFGRCQRR